MITLVDILTAINEKLINKFSIHINSNDIKEGFARPSFYVQFDNIIKTDYLQSFERGLTVRIHYFPADKHKYQLEVIEKQELIEDLFKLGFYVEDRHLSLVEGIESEVADGVLQMSFDLRYFDKGDEAIQPPKMGDLYVGD